MTKLEGVYWDLDGTIANTELEGHLPAFNLAFKDFDLSWEWDIPCYIDLLKVNGGKNRIAYYSEKINDQISTEEIIKIHERKQYHYFQFITNNCINFKTGVFRLISELYKKKVRQFIVTSSSRKQAALIIKHLFKKFNPFEFIISSDDVEYHKPNPFPYLQAMRLSGIINYNSIVFEDSIAGLKSSLAAKLPTIYIPSNIPIDIKKDIVFDGFLDTLGSKSLKANVIKGPEIKSQYVNYAYLEQFLMYISYAKY